MEDEWVKAFKKKLGDRENLEKKELYKKYFKQYNLNEKEVMECFEEIEIGFYIPVGILRPEDKMSQIISRTPATNPVQWLWWLGRNEFSDDGLVDELNIRMKKYGTSNDWQKIDTFGDLVQAWCGQKPN